MTESEINQLATRHEVNPATVVALAEGLHRSGGRAIQFDIPELGGMGQWMPGMVMVGAMGDHALKAQVDALCSELAGLAVREPETRGAPPPARWWPESLGHPDAAGAQNDSHYAYFAGRNRLAIRRGDRITVYDTTGHHIRGASQQQSGSEGQLWFTSTHGLVAPDTFPSVE
jgi:hypothetical protein